jgi:RNA polymerase sigma-54 factor
MAIKMSQGLKQQQGLAMTPQLQQAIKLLTLTHLEMTNVIAEELVENPMLEETDNEQDHNSESEGDTPAELEAREATSEDFSENPLMREKDEFDWESYADSFNSNSSAPTPNMASNSDPDEMPSYENIISKGMTLAEHLEWQLKMEDISADDWKLAQMIIGNINDDGYLEINFDELIEQSGFKREAAYELLEVIQRLDPVGCGSTNLKECLLAQARIAEERSPLLEKIIRDHLEDLQAKSFEKISKALAVSVDQVKKTALLLQNFHPKPGRLVAPQETHYILPDIFVVNIGGEFVVQVNDEGVPHLRVSKLYQEMIKKGAGKKNDTASEFVKEKLRAAEWLIKSILNRQRTIEKVAKTIVAKQQEFFKKGPKYLRPMILKDVANDIGMHESTVSRVTTNKFMHTPIGTFELKYFFNSAIGGKDGGVDIASEVLKLKIKALFAGENPNKPFSDQKVVELLAQEGLTVARRTVTKYREMLGIDSSSKRKEKA